MKNAGRHLIILMTLVVALLGGTVTAWAVEWNPANTAHWKGTYEIYAGKTYTINTQVKMEGNLTLNATGTGTATIQRGSGNTALLISTEASHKLIINGNSSCRVVVDGINKANVMVAISLYSTSTAGHQFNYVTFKRCTRPYSGGKTGSAVYINQQATFNNCIFEYCTSQKGGAILIGANTTFNSCIFRNNQGVSGGAVFVGASDEGKTGVATFNNCTFQSNSINPASGQGGAIYIESNGNSGVVITGTTTISGNTAKTGGGGIYKLGPLTVSGTLKVTGNTSGGVTNNVHIGNNTTMTIATAGLSCGSSIGATKTSATNIATGTAANCANADRNHYFFSDPGTYHVATSTTSPFYNSSSGTLYLVANATYNSWHNSAAATGCTISGGYVTHINNAAGLAYFSKDVLTKDYSGQTVYLTADINLSGHNWEPIGYLNDCAANSGKAFKGTFNGQGHTISNM